MLTDAARLRHERRQSARMTAASLASAPSATLLAWITRRHGVAHSAEARAAGFSSATIERAVRSGGLVRVRRSWLVTPDCDVRRVAAARVGGRTTCVTSAALRGLWVPAHAEAHIAVPGTASRLDMTGVRLHWGTGPAPVARCAPDDHILNVLFHVARCLPRREALAVWESAVRLGQADVETLTRVAWRSRAATALGSVASALSDSGLETHFVDLMRDAGVHVEQQVWRDGHPLDGLIGSSLAVQIDGFEHHRAADRRRDIAADARLVLRGFTVLRFDYSQILFQPDDVKETVITAIAQGLHLRRTDENR